MSMLSCDAGKPSPGGARSIKPRGSHSMSAARMHMYQAPPMARKPFVVNDAIREKVRHLAGLGVPQDDIARIVKCSPKTLRKRCRDDLDCGAADANSPVVLVLPDNGRDPELVPAPQDVRDSLERRH